MIERLKAFMQGTSAPERFTIAPDDYHVSFAGTAQDGRKFFLSQELFHRSPGSPGAVAAYVGLFLWKADGTFDEIRVEKVTRSQGLPPGQSRPTAADQIVSALLAELGAYVLQPIEVEPFTTETGGVTFGWSISKHRGKYAIHVEPGDFIVYSEPWDGEEYDT